MDQQLEMEKLFKNSSLPDFTKQLSKDSLEFTRNSRNCSGITDEEFIFMGIFRALAPCTSGRDYLQYLYDNDEAKKKRSTYFETLSSERRLGMLQDVSKAFCRLLRKRVKERGVDYLGDFPELKKRTVLAGDGHKIAHAAHDKRDKKKRFIPVGNIHLLDMHTGVGFHLSTIRGPRLRAHEMPCFRKAADDPNALEWPEGDRPIIIYDRAIVDNEFWSTQKMKTSGMDVITRKKSNMKFLFRAPRDGNTSVEINTGVVTDECVGPDNAVSMRLIVYRDPEDGKKYEFLTTIDDLEPGLIAWLYLMRWKIEKVFDTFKTKMKETKSWATGEIAQKMQSHFSHMARNLLVFILHLLDDLFNIKDDKLRKKREYSLRKREERSSKKGRSLHPQQYSLRYLYQLSCQFIRVVRNLFLDKRPIKRIIMHFRDALISYY